MILALLFVSTTFGSGYPDGKTCTAYFENGALVVEPFSLHEKRLGTVSDAPVLLDVTYPAQKATARLTFGFEHLASVDWKAPVASWKLMTPKRPTGELNSLHFFNSLVLPDDNIEQIVPSSFNSPHSSEIPYTVRTAAVEYSIIFNQTSREVAYVTAHLTESFDFVGATISGGLCI